MFSWILREKILFVCKYVGLCKIWVVVVFLFWKKNIAKILAEVIPPSPVSYLYRTKKSLSLPDHILQQGGVGSSHHCHLLPLGSRTQPTPICFATHLYSTFTIMLLFFNMALNGKNWAWVRKTVLLEARWRSYVSAKNETTTASLLRVFSGRSVSQ